MVEHAAVWNVQLADGKKYKIEFEHGTTSGKRCLKVNGKVLYKEDWLFKLVGKQDFKINKDTVGRIDITPGSAFSYEYKLMINNKPYQKFKKQRSKNSQNWEFQSFRITLEKTTMQVFVNGQEVETEGVFGDLGVETHFILESMVPHDESSTSTVNTETTAHKSDSTSGNMSHAGVIRNVSSGNKHEGIIHLLFISGVQIPEL